MNREQKLRELFRLAAELGFQWRDDDGNPVTLEGELGKVASNSGALTVRIDPHLKAEAERILKDAGITPSQAVTMFYRAVAQYGGIPFDVRIPNAETLAAFAEVEAGSGELFTGSTEEAFAQILSEKARPRT